MVEIIHKTKKKKGFSYFSSIVSISMVLLMLGLLGLILIQATKLKNQIKENMLVNIFFNENVSQNTIDNILADIKLTPYCKSVTYVSKENAAAEFSKEIGENFVGFLGYNPLRASLEIRLFADYANTAQVAEIKSKYIANAGVAEVSYQQNIFEQIEQNAKIIISILFTLALLFLFISIILIGNTIKLNLYAQRFTIRSMQLVGATHIFITKPYLTKALKNGFTGGILASVLLGLLLFYMPNFIMGIDALYDNTQHFFLFVFLVLFGVIICLLSSWYCVNKYLKMKLEDLY